jgi:hypothetical protein
MRRLRDASIIPFQPGPMEVPMLSTSKNGHTALRLVACLLLSGAAAGAVAAPNDGSGPTNEQIYCQNRAVNDYYDQVKACDANLSDIPAQNAQCKSDARADLDRAKKSCLAARTKSVIKFHRAPSAGVRQ